MRRALPLAVSMVLVVASVSACGSTKKATTTTNPSVTIGSANFPENEILADIYADALQKAGVKVTTKLNIGSREIYFKEMENGTLNVFPEYNGALLDYLQPTATAATTSAVAAALATALPSNLEALNGSAAQDNDSLTVTAAFAAAHNLKSIADLKPIENQITLGAAPEFATREEGLLGLQSKYGIKVKAFKALDESGPLTIAALNDGAIQVGDIYTTDPSVSKYHFVTLTDPLILFPAQNVTPIINKSVATSTIVNTLNAISAALTTADLVALVGGVVNDHQDASTVAAQFVSQENLG